MTFLLVTGILAVAWVVLAALLCVGLCATAAHGDRRQEEISVRARRPRRFERAGFPKTF